VLRWSGPGASALVLSFEVPAAKALSLGALSAPGPSALCLLVPLQLLSIKAPGGLFGGESLPWPLLCIAAWGCLMHHPAEPGTPQAQSHLRHRHRARHPSGTKPESSQAQCQVRPRHNVQQNARFSPPPVPSSRGAILQVFCPPSIFFIFFAAVWRGQEGGGVCGGWTLEEPLHHPGSPGALRGEWRAPPGLGEGGPQRHRPLPASTKWPRRTSSKQVRPPVAPLFLPLPAEPSRSRYAPGAPQVHHASALAAGSWIFGARVQPWHVTRY